MSKRHCLHKPTSRVFRLTLSVIISLIYLLEPRRHNRNIGAHRKAGYNKHADHITALEFFYVVFYVPMALCGKA